jgi:hypothetical protein
MDENNGVWLGGSINGRETFYIHLILQDMSRGSVDVLSTYIEEGSVMGGVLDPGLAGTKLETGR